MASSQIRAMDWFGSIGVPPIVGAAGGGAAASCSGALTLQADRTKATAIASRRLVRVKPEVMSLHLPVRQSFESPRINTRATMRPDDRGWSTAPSAGLAQAKWGC